MTAASDIGLGGEPGFLLRSSGSIRPSSSCGSSGTSTGAGFNRNSIFIVGLKFWHQIPKVKLVLRRILVPRCYLKLSLYPEWFPRLGDLFSQQYRWRALSLLPTVRLVCRASCIPLLSPSAWPSSKPSDRWVGNWLDGDPFNSLDKDREERSAWPNQSRERKRWH